MSGVRLEPGPRHFGGGSGPSTPSARADALADGLGAGVRHCDDDGDGQRVRVPRSDDDGNGQRVHVPRSDDDGDG